MTIEDARKVFPLRLGALACAFDFLNYRDKIQTEAPKIVSPEKVERQTLSALTRELRKWEGVMPVCFLKAVLKEALLLNPTSSAMLKMVYGCLSGSTKYFFTSSTRY
jgi:hypothetical protein